MSSKTIAPPPIIVTRIKANQYRNQFVFHLQQTKTARDSAIFRVQRCSTLPILFFASDVCAPIRAFSLSRAQSPLDGTDFHALNICPDIEKVLEFEAEMWPFDPFGSTSISVAPQQARVPCAWALRYVWSEVAVTNI